MSGVYNLDVTFFLDPLYRAHVVHLLNAAARGRGRVCNARSGSPPKKKRNCAPAAAAGGRNPATAIACTGSPDIDDQLGLSGNQAEGEENLDCSTGP